MTPARLEEASARIEDREYYASVAPHLHAIASELLDEVKRLRGVLNAIDDRGDECHRHCGTCACGQWCSQRAADALAGEEPTP